MSLMDFAKDELTRAGWFKPDGFYGDMMGHAVLKMVELFADEGHSGMSAGIAVSLFSKLAAYEPLTPLTGEPDEWTDIGDGFWQNKRCPRVFKGLDGRAYDIEGRVFHDADGSRFTSRESRVFIEFPYSPTTEYVPYDAAREATNG